MKLDLINIRFAYGKEAFYIYPDDPPPNEGTTP